MGQVSGKTNRVQIVEIRDNQDKSEKGQMGRLSHNDRVRFKLVEGEEPAREISVREFIFNDELKDLGSPSQRTLLLTRKTTLPLGKGIFHYLRAKLNAEAPLAKVYAFARKSAHSLPGCTKDFSRFEIDFTPEKKPTPFFLTYMVVYYGLYENGLTKLGGDKFLLGDRSYLPPYLESVQAFFGANSTGERKISIQCLLNGEIQLSRTRDVLVENSVAPNLYGPKVNFSPEDISRLGLHLTGQDGALQLAWKLRALAWSWITGFTELI